MFLQCSLDLWGGTIDALLRNERSAVSYFCHFNHLGVSHIPQKKLLWPRLWVKYEYLGSSVTWCYHFAKEQYKMPLPCQWLPWPWDINWLYLIRHKLLPWSEPSANQKAVDHLRNYHATLARMGKSWLAGWYFISQGPYLGKTVGDFLPPGTFIAPSSIVKANRSVPAWILLVLQLK